MEGGRDGKEGERVGMRDEGKEEEVKERKER